jgi:hypothetical protein
MPVTLINGYVLLPHAADWSDLPQWRRTWETGIAAGLTGKEQRQSVRALGREQVSYLIYAQTIEERAQLDERLDAAAKSGLVCAPFYGRASTLSTPASTSSTSLTLTDTVWPWAIGDYAFLYISPGVFDVVHLTAVAGTALTLAGAPARNYPAGAQLWPLLVGKYTADTQSAETSWHESVKVTIAELVPRHQPTIGTAPTPSGSGIGTWKIGSTFVIS